MTLPYSHDDRRSYFESEPLSQLYPLPQLANNLDSHHHSGSQTENQPYLHGRRRLQPADPSHPHEHQRSKPGSQRFSHEHRQYRSASDPHSHHRNPSRYATEPHLLHNHHSQPANYQPRSVSVRRREGTTCGPDCSGSALSPQHPCAGCSKPGAACPAGCTSQVTFAPPAAAQNPCADCGIEGAHCPKSCGETVLRPGAGATPEACWMCHQLGAHCPRSCREERLTKGEGGDKSPPESGSASCSGCRRVGGYCPPHCREVGGSPTRGRRAAASKLQPFKRPSAQKSSAENRNPFKDGRCWLCDATGEVCGTPCDNATALFPATWAFFEESSCWLCDDFTSLCPPECSQRELPQVSR